MSFVRRFTSFPPLDVITAIEGINVVDLPPPGSVEGVNANVIALVGEFDDCTFACDVGSTGAVTGNPHPVEIFSGQDLLDKLGGWDATLGEFGISQGNGFVELRNKRFGRLVVVPVNLASAWGIRMWRKLPTNTSATSPVPVVPVSAAAVAAGTTFKQASAAVELIKPAQQVKFGSAVSYKSGTDGSVTNAAAAATTNFTSAGGGFLTANNGLGVQKGDALVMGVIGAGGAQGTNADTYRVNAVTSDTVLVIEKLDGTNFSMTTSAVMAWRLHPASTIDSYGGNLQFGSQVAYTVRCRPLTKGDGTGAQTDGTWPVGTLLSPVVAPPALSATTADPLSGLAGAVGPSQAVPFTAAVQKANAPSSSAVDVIYLASIDGLKLDSTPANEVNHVWSARKSATIRTKLLQHCIDMNDFGKGRTCSISPEVNQVSLSTVLGDADPGVGANRHERTWYDWPATRTLIPEAVGTPIVGADGSIVTDGTLDLTGDGWLASIVGVLAPERNPGEATDTTKGALSPIIGYGRGTPNLDINSFKSMKAKGICGIRMDKTSGPVFQSGVTTSLTAGLTTINRRRMADYVEDTLSTVLQPFSKLPLTDSLKDAAVGEVDDFLSQLLSADNAAAQRINSYLIDDKSGNTPALEAAGVFVIIVKVRTLATADFLVIQAEVGQGVVTTTRLGGGA